MSGCKAMPTGCDDADGSRTLRLAAASQCERRAALVVSRPHLDHWRGEANWKQFLGLDGKEAHRTQRGLGDSTMRSAGEGNDERG